MANNNNNNDARAFAFRIHEPRDPQGTAPTAASTMAGWSQTSHIQGSLLNNITIGVSSNKTGTSIPSIFARLYLFEGAFQALGNLNVANLNEVTEDVRLISECLDLLEFLFQHGNDPKLVVKHWNAAQQINVLRNDGYDAHKKLAKVLEDEIGDGPLKDIFLFYWKASSSQGGSMDREFLIGGTSPFTLVFTSPNWKRIIRENQFHFNRINGNTMFFDDVEMLNTRDEEFKDMLYSLRMAYSNQMDQYAHWFNTYLTNFWNIDVQKQEVLAMGNNPAAFEAKYKSIKDENDARVMAGNLPLGYLPIVPDTSGYEIVPKSNRFVHYLSADGQNIVLKAPLVLNANGLPGVKYVGKSKWDPQTCIIDEEVVRNTAMHDRILPGNSGVKYPFLIWSDFLEDKIVKLPYRINKDCFYTATDGDTSYLLPLTREFFKYFNPEDIDKAASEQADKKLVQMVVRDNAVTVTINVPIKDNTYSSIEFKRTYQGADIIDSEFVLGFFPFYRCTNNPQLNRYNVMNCGNETRLSFVSLTDLNGVIYSESVVRTPQRQITAQTEYYTISNGFDLVEVVTKNTGKCVIVPKMKTIDPTQAPNHYSFAVDFGTSNTYIARTCSANQQTGPETFEIGDSDKQTVFLNNPSDTPMYIMRPFMQREFAPEGLGGRYGVSFPVRTATCEVPDFESRPPRLFGTVSIGFNMMREPQVPNGLFKYKTGLKWLLENDPGNVHHTNRINCFFQEILWMMKNESLLNEGGDAFDVYLTFPQSMVNQQAIINLWHNAINTLGLQHCILHHGAQYSESIAPYNCMVQEIQASSYLNIDIGGGTNDMLFVNRVNGQIQSVSYSSAKFAGDDLWGDGPRILNNQPSNNGFVTYLTGLIDAAVGVFEQEIINPLNALRLGLASSSADIMSYLFKYDNVFGTTSKIRGQQYLWSLVFVHYAAIMYNVARLIKKQNIEIPPRISFTGMGSKYLSIISGNDGVNGLTKLLLEKYTGKTVPADFRIIKPVNTDVKEITAKGVLRGIDINNQNFVIPANALVRELDYGFDTTDTITYAQVKDAGGVVRKQALEEFYRFVESLKGSDFRNFLFANYGLTIPNQLIEDLKAKGEASFITMSTSIPAQFDQLGLVETLFFWPLKTALVELSNNYNNY